MLFLKISQKAQQYSNHVLNASILKNGIKEEKQLSSRILLMQVRYRLLHLFTGKTGEKKFMLILMVLYIKKLMEKQDGLLLSMSISK